MTFNALIDIDIPDNFELVGAQIAGILKTEIVNQVKLAGQANRDPSEWDIRIFHERANPWEMWLNQDVNASDLDERPVVNVWFDQGTFDAAASNQARQKLDATYNIDVYGYRPAADDPECGHKPGDQWAAFASQKAIRLCRQLLMLPDNRYLQLRGTVWGRMPRSITMFQVQLDSQAAIQVHGARFALDVQFSEFPPQTTYATLDILAVDVKRVEDGEIVLQAEYEYS